jgi:predicted TIM-barrel fold metal-dependent hydrolase
VLPEIFEYLEKSLSEVKARTKNRKERNRELFSLVLEHYGIDKAVMLPIFNLDVAFSIELQAKNPEKVVGFGFLNPIDNHVEKKYEFLHRSSPRPKGIKLHAEFSKFNPTIHRIQFERFFEFIQEEKMVVLFHTGTHFNIRELSPLIKQFPDVKVILGHSGLGSQINQAVECAQKFPNVYLELSGQPYSYMIKNAVKSPEIGVERILYGSDLPSLHPTVEQMKVLSLPISEAEKQLIFADNIERILR